MSNRLGGKQGTAYLGTNANQPPNVVYNTRNPTPTDTQYSLNDFWLNESDESLWYLASLAGNMQSKGSVADWKQLWPGSTLAAVTFTTQGGSPAIFVNDNLNVFGGSNITTNSLSGNDTITIDLNPNVNIPGSLQVGGLSNGVVFADATGNLFTANGTDGQVIVGGGVAPIFTDLIAGTNINFVTGPNSLTINATGGGGSGTTSFITDIAGPAVPTGGGALNLIGNGTVIQTDGSVANTVQIMLTEPDPGYVLAGNGAGLQPTFFQLLGGGSIVVTPGVGTITISDGGGGGGGVVQLTGDVGAAAQDGFNNINVFGGGTTNIITTGAASTLTVALVDNPVTVGSLTVGTDLTVLGLGGTPGVVQVDNAGLFSASSGNDGEILIGATGGAPAWANITAGAGISITNNPNSITITNIGGGGGGSGAINFITNSGTAVVTSGNIQVYGDGVFPLGNIQTSANPSGGNVVTVNLNASIQLPMTNTNINNLSRGQFWIGGNRFMHMWGPNTNDANTFLGRSAGNFTFGQTAAVRNTGMGAGVLNSLTTGGDNTAVGRRAATGITSGSLNTIVGSNAASSLTIGSQNVVVGYNAFNSANSGVGNIAIGTDALSNLTSNNANIAIGPSAGSSLTAGASNIYIGNVGVASESNTNRISTSAALATYIGGIYQKSVGASNSLVFADSNQKIGTSAGGTNGQVPIAATGGDVRLASITSSDNSIAITAGANTLDLTVRNIAFNARLGTDVADVTGDGTLYMYGSTQAFTQVYNIGGGTLTLGGGGTNLSFRAPVSGVYRFQVNCLLGDLINPATTPPNPVCPLMLMVRNNPATTPNVRTYALIGSFWWPQTSDPDFPEVMNYFWTADIQLTALQYVVCGISLTYGAGTRTLDLISQTNIPIFYGDLEGTFFSGSLLARQ